MTPNANAYAQRRQGIHFMVADVRPRAGYAIGVARADTVDEHVVRAFTYSNDLIDN